MNLFRELNRDQSDGLANLYFDLAKAAFIIAFLPAAEIGQNTNLIIQISKSLSALILGIVFTYGAMIILKRKEKLKK